MSKKSVKITPAFTVIRNGEGWSVVELYCDPDWNVVDIKIAQPDVKAISHEAFKIAVGKYWLELEK